MDRAAGYQKNLAYQPLSDVSMAKRVKLAARDGGMRCAYCKREGRPEEFVLDHVVPASRGGPDGSENRVLACPRCDGIKGNRTPQEWRPGARWDLEVLEFPTRARTSRGKPAPVESKKSRRRRRARQATVDPTTQVDS